MKYLITAFISIFSVGYCWADYSSRGRPFDAPDYHESPLSIVIAVILLIAITGIWLVCKIKENKDAIIRWGRNLFIVGSIFCCIIIVGKCGESLNSKSSSQSRSITTHDKPPYPTTVSSPPQVQPKHTPIQKYRTVEYYESCIYCNGSGKVICLKCGGTGLVDKICHHCNGVGNFGEFKCFDCQVNSHKKELGLGSEICFRCNGTGYITKICDYCSGSGKISEICDFNAYVNHDHHYITCSHCNGLGEIRRTRQECYYE